MARVGVSITKSTSFRGATQEFSNVYYYDMSGVPTISEADAIIDKIVAKEKTMHATNVTFVKGRLWHETGDKQTTNMISTKTLSGTGSQSTITGFDKERAFLVRIRAGNDSRGNPVYLRKWWHSCGQFDAAVSSSGTILENTAGFNTAERNAIVAKVGWVGNADGAAGQLTLVSKKGRVTDAGAPWQAHQYLEHRQLGDMWRAT